MRDFRNVDPRELRLPGARHSGADPLKLQLQTAQFRGSQAGMPVILVYEASDGVLVVYNGVTRATRIAKLDPGAMVLVEVIGQLRKPHSASPKVGDRL